MTADWLSFDTAPVDGTIVWLASGHSMCPAYFMAGAWRNWYKGCRYENHALGVDAFLPEHIWFEPTHWSHLPELPA